MHLLIMPRFRPLRRTLAILLILPLIFLIFVTFLLSLPNPDAITHALPNIGLPGQIDSTKPPRHKPAPSWVPPPIQDPFPLLENSEAPPIPAWNVPREGLHVEYNLTLPPPLLIGFGRTWPVLLQCVVSYITAGWPPSQIYVVENTGVQLANKRGQLTLQNPFYLNYAILQDRLGVNVIRTPAILSFAQMQNFFLNQALENKWPYYLFSHSDQLIFSHEDGLKGVTPAAGEPGYKTVYELVVQYLAEVESEDERWGKILFAFNDYLTAFRTEAMDELGGWDSMIPFYSTDCDMYSRMRMGKYRDYQRKPGVFNDVGSVLGDLGVMYRATGAAPPVMTPLNQLEPGTKAKGPDGQWPVPGGGWGGFKIRRRWLNWGSSNEEVGESEILKKWREAKDVDWNNSKTYFRALKEVGGEMGRIKVQEKVRGRNTWQMAQRAGVGEPYYYSAEGISAGIHMLTMAGQKNYLGKWGIETCGADKAGLELGDAWNVLPRWQW